MTQAQSSQPKASAVDMPQVSDSQATHCGMAIWSRLLALNADSRVIRARTLFIPSDSRHLPGEAMTILLNPGSKMQREKLLKRSASDEPVSVSEIGQRRVQLKTLDGGFLTIDATGNEIRVGDVEAISVHKLEDGRVVFVLDDIITGSLPEKPIHMRGWLPAGKRSWRLGGSRLRSCVRPVYAALMTAGPDGIR
jgi:hypothetical protein